MASLQDACSENKKRITAYGPRFTVWRPDTHAICLIHCLVHAIIIIDATCGTSWMMMITKNSCDLSHRGVEIESQYNIKPSEINLQASWGHWLPQHWEVHNTLASLPFGDLSWQQKGLSVISGLEGWNGLRNIIMFFHSNTQLCCVAAYKLIVSSALYWPAFMFQACTIFSCMKNTYSKWQEVGWWPWNEATLMYPWTLRVKSHMQ